MHKRALSCAAAILLVMLFFTLPTYGQTHKRGASAPTTPQATTSVLTVNSTNPLNMSCKVSGNQIVGKAGPTGAATFRDATLPLSLGTGTLGGAVAALQFNYAPTIFGNSSGIGDAIIADFNHDGIPDLAYVNWEQVLPSTLNIALGNGDGTFKTPVSYNAGMTDAFDTVPDIVAADFNGDGKLDVAITNNVDNTISVFVGNGDGTFKAQVTYAVGSNPWGIVAADFNGDGKMDLAVENTGDSTISILLGKGDGTFQPQTTISPVTGLAYLATADVNHDGKADLVVSDQSTNSVAVLLGKGDGTFQTPIVTKLNGTPKELVLADLNGDGKLDLAAQFPWNWAGSLVAVLMGKGDGTFQTEADYVVDGGGGLVTADIHKDGKLDLVSGGSWSNTVSILAGNGDGTFQQRVIYSTPPYPDVAAFVMAGDLNGDGRPDVVVITSDNPSFYLSVWMNTLSETASSASGNLYVPVGTNGTHDMQCSYPGDANYAASTSAAVSVTFPLADPPTISPRGGAYNAPALVSFSHSSPSATIYYTTDGSLPTTSSSVYTTPFAVSAKTMLRAMAVAPNYQTSATNSAYYWFPAATTTTLLTQDISAKAISYLRTPTSVTLTAAVMSGGSPVTSGPVMFCDNAVNTQCTGNAYLGTGQLKPDGTASANVRIGFGTHQLVATFVGTLTYGASSSTPKAFKQWWKSGASFSHITSSAGTTSGSYNLTTTLTGLSPAANGPMPTGTVNFVDTSNGNAVVATAPLVPSIESGMRFQNTSLPYVGTMPFAIATGDFNHDGNVDLAVINDGGGAGKATVSVLLGTSNGYGAFQAQTQYAISDTPRALAVADVNHDGNLDLVIANGTGVDVLLGVGDGTFLTPTHFASGLAGGAASLAIADLNHDGNLDLVVADALGNNSVMLGDATGHFPTNTTFNVSSGGESVVIGDFNGDGIPDLAIGNSFSFFSTRNLVTVLLGTGDGTFGPAQTYVSGKGAGGLVLGDFNGDGKLDIATVDYGDVTVSVLLGNGDGSFKAPVSTPVTGFLFTLTTADFDGDGIPDLAVTMIDGNVYTLKGAGDGTFTIINTYNVGMYPYGVVAADLNGDGRQDFLVASQGNGVSQQHLRVYLNWRGSDATVTANDVIVPGSGTHQIKAYFAGDANYRQANSATVGLTAVPTTTKPAK